MSSPELWRLSPVDHFPKVGTISSVWSKACAQARLLVCCPGRGHWVRDPKFDYRIVVY